MAIVFSQSASPEACVPHGPQRSAGNDAGRDDSGFTLLEVLVVIAIIGLLVGLVAPAALRQLGGARVSVAKQSIERLGAVLDMYKLDIGTYPDSSDGLRALLDKPAGAANWNGPYLKAENGLNDPWNHPYIYRIPSQRTGHEYDLCSRGPTSQGTSEGDTICNP